MFEPNFDLLASGTLRHKPTLESPEGSFINDLGKRDLKIISLRNMVRDSARIFREQNRADLVADEVNQLSYLEVYLPEQMPEQEVREVVREIIAQVGASSFKDIGRCMGPLMDRLKGMADGSLISRIVKEELS